MVKTPPSHGGFKGSNPLRVTMNIQPEAKASGFLFFYYKGWLVRISRFPAKKSPEQHFSTAQEIFSHILFHFQDLLAEILQLINICFYDKSLVHIA